MTHQRFVSPETKTRQRRRLARDEDSPETKTRQRFVSNETKITEDPEVDPTIGILDKKVALLVFNASRLGVSDDSLGGQKIAEIVDAYREHLVYGTNGNKLEDLLEFYYPSRSSRRTMVFETDRPLVQVGAGRTPEKEVEREQRIKLLGLEDRPEGGFERSDEKKRPEGGFERSDEKKRPEEFASHIAMRQAEDEAVGSIRKELDVLRGEMKEVRDVLSSIALGTSRLDELISESMQQQEQNMNLIVKTERGLFHDLKSLIGGRATIASIFANGIASVFKWLVLTVAMVPLKLAKLIYWDSWVYPIKMTLKKLADKTVWIGGILLLVSIGGVWYAQSMTSSHPEFGSMCPNLDATGLYGPDVMYCDLGNVGYEILEELKKPYFDLRWSYDGLLTLSKDVLTYYNPPMIILYEGKKAFGYLGRIYGEWITNYLLDLATQAAERTGEVAKEKALSYVPSPLSWFGR